MFLGFESQGFLCASFHFSFLFFYPIIFSINIHTTQMYPGSHGEFNWRLIICLFLLLCVDAVMFHALARACNQSVLPHNMPPVCTRTQHLLTGVYKVQTDFFLIYEVKLVACDSWWFEGGVCMACRISKMDVCVLGLIFAI